MFSVDVSDATVPPEDEGTVCVSCSAEVCSELLVPPLGSESVVRVVEIVASPVVGGMGKVCDVVGDSRDK